MQIWTPSPATWRAPRASSHEQSTVGKETTRTETKRSRARSSKVRPPHTQRDARRRSSPSAAGCHTLANELKNLRLHADEDSRPKPASSSSAPVQLPPPREGSHHRRRLRRRPLQQRDAQSLLKPSLWNGTGRIYSRRRRHQGSQENLAGSLLGTRRPLAHWQGPPERRGKRRREATPASA